MTELGEQLAGERLFGVALGVPEPYATELQAWRERLGDPDARQIAPHITLAGPITIDPGDLEDVDAALRDVAARHTQWTVRLDGCGSFRPVTPVVFAAVAAGSQGCAELAADIREHVITEAPAYPYHPHVTIAHNLSDAQLDAAEAALASYSAGWRVWGFTLFERGADLHWRPQRDYPFGAAVGPRPPG